MIRADDTVSLLAQGHLLGSRYRADTLLGRGGMGEVWRCHDVEQSRPVALKVIRKDFTAEAWSARLFRGEVLAMARLAHPGIIPIYDFAEEPQVGSYFVMEYRPGASMAALADDPPPWPVLCALLDDLLDGLGYAHSKRVVHLDMKPDNVLVSNYGDGRLRPTLLDFGIARVRRPGQGVEQWADENLVMGTVAYMAPEQASGEVGRLGRWSDLYAVGAMLYEIVSGQPPFPRAALMDSLLARILDPAPRLVPRDGYDVPEELVDLVAELLQTEPFRRPRFAADVRAALRAIDRSSAPPLPIGFEKPAPAKERAPIDADSIETTLQPLAESSPLGTAPTAFPEAAAPARDEPKTEVVEPPEVVIKAGGEAPASERVPRRTQDLVAAWLADTRPAAAVHAAAPLEQQAGETKLGGVGGRALAQARTLLARSELIDAIVQDGRATPGRRADSDETGAGAPGADTLAAEPPSLSRRVAATTDSISSSSIGLGFAATESSLHAEPDPPAAGAYGLYGLRDLPLLGRFGERQAIWEEVRHAFTDGLPRAVFLEGPAGVGKSRLARDVIERGEQLGLLEGMQTWWSETPSGDDGLRGLLENVLDCRGAGAGEVLQRLTFWLAGIEGDHELFTRDVRLFLRPPPDVPFDKALPYRVAVELIERAATRRPVLLWLDDVQWGAGEVLSLLKRLLGHDPLLPVCVVATLREGEKKPEGYDELVASDRTRRVRLERLDLKATKAFVRGLLDVDDQLRDLLAERAEGNPLFAAQLLHQLVEADALERREGRYRLSKQFDLNQIPADITDLWDRRLTAAIPDPALRAALLPFAVVRERLSPPLAATLRELLGADMSGPKNEFDAALGQAQAAGLIVEEEGALRFAHGLLRDHVLSHIAEAERPRLHDLAAGALAPLAAGGEDCEAERADHLRAAERPEECVQALRRAIEYSRTRGETGEISIRANRLLSWSEALDERQRHPPQAFALVQLARLDEERGQLDEADAKLDEAENLAGPAEHLAALDRRAMVLRKRGRYDDALAVYDEVTADAQQGGDTDAAARALWGKAESLRRLGRAAEATPLYDEALAGFLSTGNERLAARVRRSLGWIHLDKEELAEAGRCFEDAREVFARLGDANGELLVESALSGWHEARGEYARAVEHEGRALALALRLDLAYFAAFSHVNIALTEARRGDYAAATEHAGAATALEGGLRASDVRTGHAFVVAEIAAAGSDPDKARGALENASALQRESGFTVPELPQALERGAALARTRGFTDLRRALLEEASRLWRLLGQEEDARRVETSLASGATGARDLP